MTRYWRKWVSEETQRQLPKKLSKVVTNLVGNLSVKWKLRTDAKMQPPINVDDLLFTTWHLLAASKYNTEDDVLYYSSSWMSDRVECA
ncbi:hypothetical protein N7449_001992 [Penicillium cf. viridicatum]|uniref:Uncharacterized protein n=1 Tax=Penicillium cf. viridicatum TaxID=2972119 RepID=A0A9W9MU96_9EURO|nr:hypothetical protein N7449_001992 [Penicillium cf. viridicatum]